MASNTFTTNYQIKLIGTGLEAGTWGRSTNQNLERIEQALGGSSEVAVDLLPGFSAGGGGEGTVTWLTSDAAAARAANSEGRDGFVTFKSTVDVGALGIEVKIRGTSSGIYPSRIFVAKNSLSDSRDLILNCNSTPGSNTYTVGPGAYALVYSVGIAGGSVANALSKLQVDELLFNIGADIVIPSDDAAALEVKDSAATYIKVDTTTQDLAATPPEYPVVNLMTRDVVTGVSGSTSVIKSSGDADLTLKTGNTLTGSISIVDGDSGAISIAPETAGKIVVGETARTASITGATKANPVVITNSSTNSFVNGEVVKIVSVGGMVELNGNTYTVANRSDTTFELSGVNGTGYTTYTSGGTATSADPLNITTSGTNNLVLDTNLGTASGSITVTEEADKNILIEPDGSGKVIVGNSGATGKLSTGGARDLVIGTNDTPAYFTDATCDLTIGDLTVEMDSTSSIAAGMAVLGDGIPAGATVDSITDGTDFELSTDKEPTITQENVTLTFGGPGAEIKVEEGINGGIVLQPINTGAVTIATDAIISGTDGYLNFDDVVGSLGYGIRNHKRAPQAKNFNWDWTNILTNVKSFFMDLDRGTTGVGEQAEAVTSSNGTSILTCNAKGWTTTVGQYAYLTGLSGTIGTSAYDLTQLNDSWWKIEAVDAGVSFDIDILDTIVGTDIAGGLLGRFQLNEPGLSSDYVLDFDLIDSNVLAHTSTPGAGSTPLPMAADWFVTGKGIPPNTRIVASGTVGDQIGLSNAPTITMDNVPLSLCTLTGDPSDYPISARGVIDFGSFTALFDRRWYPSAANAQAGLYTEYIDVIWNATGAAVYPSTVGHPSFSLSLSGSGVQTGPSDTKFQVEFPSLLSFFLIGSTA